MLSVSDCIEVRLYSRTACSLCERAQVVLRRLADEKLITWQHIEINDTHRYATRVPVVELATGALLEGRISEFRLRRLLTNVQAPS